MKTVRKLALLLLLPFLMGAGHVQAAGNSITVSPAQVDIELATTDVKKSANFTITNSYNVPVVLSVELKGIDQESGRIIPSENVDHDLIMAVHISETLITVPEQTTTFVTLEVNNVPELSPGGHYGTVVFTQQKIDDKQLNFTQAISAGLFVVKRGGQLREIDAKTFKTHGYPFQVPGSAELTFKNVGNVYLTPRASVLVYDQQNNLVAKGIANTESRRLLQGKELSDTFTITQSRRLWWPQRIKTVLEYRADSIEEAKTMTKTQLYIPFFYVPLFILLMMLLWVLGKRKMQNRRKHKHLRKHLPDELIATGDSLDTQHVEHSKGAENEPEVSPKKKSKKRRKINVSTLEP